ncbi:phosphonate metabolism transcriptional regulator PhnF [Limnohabitans sp. Rim28]|jgi:GntR family phosphonate transport system transcriptional regulator|nr:phosphonate metabolism transcriptional regulator PhnF [Limnohabitans sp. Rim28]
MCSFHDKTASFLLTSLETSLATSLALKSPHHEEAGATQPERDSYWSRIAQQLANAIGQGHYTPGERLPSEHVLAEQFGVNRHTIRRSLAHLGQRGLVRATQGRGTFVEAFAVDLALGKRTRYRQNLAQAGVRGGLQILQSRTVLALADQAQALKVGVGSPLLCLQVLGEGAGQPLHVSERYFPLPRFSGLADAVAQSGSITEAFAQHGVNDYQRQESRISARLPSPDVAALLCQVHTRPVLLVSSVNVDPGGVPIEFALAWFAGDRVTLTVKNDEL